VASLLHIISNTAPNTLTANVHQPTLLIIPIDGVGFVTVNDLLGTIWK
jgi:hypothetical protein